MCQPKGYGFSAIYLSLKTGIDFPYFGLDSGMVFEVTYSSVWMYLLFQFQMNQKE